MLKFVKVVLHLKVNCFAIYNCFHRYIQNATRNIANILTSFRRLCKAENRYESWQPLTKVIFYLQPLQLERIRRREMPVTYAGSWCTSQKNIT